MTYQLYWRRNGKNGSACHLFRGIAEIHYAILRFSGAVDIDLVECEPV